MEEQDRITRAKLVSNIIYTNKEYQKILAKIVCDMNHDEIVQLAADTSDERNQISSHTLGQYKRVYNKIKHLDLPEWMNYTTWRLIAFSRDPDQRYQEILDNEMTNKEIRDKWIKKVEKSGEICPQCGFELNK